ncbi:MAG: Trm112 family protein [Candidatus Baldrarchaeia archaeon]
MKYRLIDLLACPICKNSPLKLHVLKQEKQAKNNGRNQNTMQTLLRIPQQKTTNKGKAQLHRMPNNRNSRRSTTMPEMPEMVPNNRRNPKNAPRQPKKKG